MINLLLNVQLKYKFWLLNAVSFLIVCLLVISAMNLSYEYILDIRKQENQETLTTVQKAFSAISRTDQIKLVESSNYLAIQVPGHQSTNGKRVNELISSEALSDFFTSKSETQFKSYGLFSTQPDLVAHKVLMSDGSLLVRAVSSPSLFQVFKNQAPRYAIVVALLMTLLLICSQLLISFFEKHINSLKRVMLHVKDSGDLTARVEIESNDEVGQMAYAFNQMQKKYQATVKLLSTSAHALHDSAVSLKESAVKTEQDMEQQQAETSSILEAITQLTSVANEVAQNATEMQSESESAASLTASGETEVLSSKEITHTLNDEISQVSSLVEQLQSDTKRIDSTTNEIQVISEQTNLLALNAAIEAARAGDSGRGFAVVADEVRALAQHAHESSEKIQELVDAIRNVTSEIINVMESGMETAQNTVSSSERTVELFSQIRQLAESIKGSNLLVASAAEEQSQTSLTIAQTLEQVKGGADKVLSNAIDVTKSSETIQTLADELESIVDSMIV